MKRRAGRRRLRLANSGKWYVAMTIGFGVIAISSGNNVLYLLESLLLGGLILSGVLSERAVAIVDVTWRRRPAPAGEAGSDVFVVRNKSRLPLFCIEVGEWSGGEMKTRLFVPFVPGGSSVTVSNTISYPARGEFKWQGVSFATQYPFGFAKKIRWIEDSGKRLVWPARRKATPQGGQALRTRQPRVGEVHGVAAESSRLGQTSRHGSAEFADGEIRALQPGDDYRDVIWTLSVKRGEPVVRQRQSQQTVREVTLDLRRDPGPDFESALVETAEHFYREGHGILVLVDWTGHRRVEGMKPALDVLATVQASGRKPAGRAA